MRLRGDCNMVPKIGGTKIPLSENTSLRRPSVPISYDASFGHDSAYALSASESMHRPDASMAATYHVTVTVYRYAAVLRIDLGIGHPDVRPNVTLGCLTCNNLIVNHNI